MLKQLGRFFEKAEVGNERIKYYRSEFLCADFKSVLINLAMSLNEREQSLLCAECSIISDRELRLRKMKTIVKNLLGRS